MIAHALDIGLGMVDRVRRKYSAEGLHSALYEKPRPGALKKPDPKSEALLIDKTCSPALNGRSHWALRLLAERGVEMGLVEKISYETVRRTLKKELKPGRAASSVCQKSMRLL